jgi:hypothetical protein
MSEVRSPEILQLHVKEGFDGRFSRDQVSRLTRT